jgi:nucleoside-diphosphate-sugar epimerase
VALKSAAKVRPRALVTSGAGIIGSCMCERLIAEGCAVVCVDNLLRGQRQIVKALVAHERLEFASRDVCNPFRINGSLDWILHLSRWPRRTTRSRGDALLIGATGLGRLLGAARIASANASPAHRSASMHTQPSLVQVVLPCKHH